MTPITWMTNTPVWVAQWPLSKEKLEAASQLVQEQLQLGHLEPSQSPWNTPIFIIKKKSGKWRLLHDLRAVNRQMQVMGAIQRGLPALSALPKNWEVIVVDIKDCFFSIPLNARDKERFAFTLPSINHERPDRRFQWIVLPQGMANSPTLCQLYVDAAIQPLREEFPKIRIVHYMDDILLAAPSENMLDNALACLATLLSDKGLCLAPEKVQKGKVVEFLGSRISKTAIVPQKVEIRTSQLSTLNNFQKLLGDINWIRPYLKITRAELQPLFRILEGDPDLNSPRTLTPEARVALKKVENAITNAQLSRYEDDRPLWLCILPTMGFPTGVVWQEGPLLWIHSKSIGIRILTHYPSMVAEIALLGLKNILACFACAPEKLIVPYTKEQVEVLAATTTAWAILVCSFSGVIDNHLPHNELLKFFIQQPVIFPKITANQPLSHALTIYTDGSRSGRGAYMVQGEEPVIVHSRPEAPQVVECYVVLDVFRRFQEPFNLVSDSQYVVNAVTMLEVVSYVKPSSMVAPIFEQIRQEILSRSNPFYITHIRAHSLLPGPMSAANQEVDLATRAFIALDAEQQAREFHRLYHVSSNTLRRKFSIPRCLAREIVKNCSGCAPFLASPSEGVNPRGLSPLEIWQMDVTHLPSFGRLQYVHVSVDTCSGVMHATPLSGEKVSHVITHCLEAWAAWGKPLCLKTDNGPAYTSKGFAAFCQRMQVKHITGLPYNPQGQGIVERANRTLKELLQKQKGGIAEGCPPKQRISLALFTINFLALNDADTTAAMRHESVQQQDLGSTLWKDVLSGQWRGPDRILMRSRGALCVSPQDQDPIWVPRRLARPVKTQDGPPVPVPADVPAQTQIGKADVLGDQPPTRQD